MEKAPQIIAEEIHLLKIDIVQNKIDVSGFKKTPKPNLGIGHKFMHNLKDERVKFEMVFSFKNNKEQEILFVQIDFHYHIEKMDNFYKINNENKPIFYGLMIATLLGICLSTARGILYEKLESNGIKNIIIPVVSPQKLLTNSH
jgi:hypothetical protein